MAWNDETLNDSSSSGPWNGRTCRINQSNTEVDTAVIDDYSSRLQLTTATVFSRSCGEEKALDF